MNVKECNKVISEILKEEELDRKKFWKESNAYDDEFIIVKILNEISTIIGYNFITPLYSECYGMVYYYSKTLKKYIVLDFDYDFRRNDNFMQFIQIIKGFEREAEAIELKIRNGVSDE